MDLLVCLKELFDLFLMATGRCCGWNHLSHSNLCWNTGNQ